MLRHQVTAGATPLHKRDGGRRCRANGECSARSFRPIGPSGPSGGRGWWAHFEFTRMNIEPTILHKKIEELRERP